MPNLPKRQLLVVLLTVFLDLLGVSLVIPVAAPLFLSADVTFFANSAALEYKTLILGILLGTAPIVQFFSAPLLGAMSDRRGRKPVLLLSVLVTGVGHALFGLGIVTGQLWLLFFSRFLSGAGAGNLSAANSVVVDISEPGEKVQNFGLIGVALGLGFIFGPFLGGKLSDPSVVSWFSFATPLWVATALAALNACIILFFFRETIRQRIHTPMNLLTGVHNIKRAFSLPNLRSLYAVSFLLGFGYNFFTQFFSVFMIARFQFTAAQIGVLFAYVGVWIAISQGVVTRIVSRFVQPASIIRWAPIATAVVLLFLAAVRHVQTVYLLLPLAALAYGLNPPNMNALISDAADERSQGEALGINQSMSALSFGLPPVLAGLAVSISIAMPMVLAAFFIMLAWFVFMRTRGRVREPVFHEVS